MIRVSVKSWIHAIVLKINLYWWADVEWSVGVCYDAIVHPLEGHSAFQKRNSWGQRSNKMTCHCCVSLLKLLISCCTITKTCNCKSVWWFWVSNVFVRRMLQQKVIVWVDRLCAELSQGLGHVATALHPGVWGTTVIWTTVYWTLSKTRPQPSTQTCMLSTLVLDHIPNLKNATNKLCCRDLPVIQDQYGIFSLDPIEIVAGESH